MLLSMTASAQTTYLDSLNRAFDNCVFLHDSLAKELTLYKEYSAIDLQTISECEIETKILEGQINELNTQKTAMQSIIEKVSFNQKQLEKQAKKEKLKQLISYPIISVGAGAIGFVIGWFSLSR